MNKVFGLVFCLAILMTITGCQKDYSVENSQTLIVLPPIYTAAAGSLQDESGNCMAITVNGNYTQDTALTSKNTITVTVNFTKTGRYKLYTDTVNGCWFSMDSATTYNTGIKTVTLRGNGTPVVQGTSYFNVFFQNSVCSFSVLTNSLSKSERDYFPMSIGSYWTYDTLPNTSATDTVRYTVSPSTQVKSGQTYRLFSSSRASDSHYYRKNYKGQYYEYTDIFSGFSIPPFEYMFLDDTKPVGSVFYQSQTFTGTYQGQPAAVSIKLTIVEKNINYTFANSITLDSVIHVRQDITLTLSGRDISSSILPNDVYYAKNIGLISYASPTPQVYRIAQNWIVK